MEAHRQLKGINHKDRERIYKFIDERIQEVYKNLETTAQLADMTREQGRIEELRTLKRQIVFYSKVNEE